MSTCLKPGTIWRCFVWIASITTTELYCEHQANKSDRRNWVLKDFSVKMITYLLLWNNFPNIKWRSTVRWTSAGWARKVMITCFCWWPTKRIVTVVLIWLIIVSKSLISICYLFIICWRLCFLIENISKKSSSSSLSSSIELLSDV